jgi:hypothetical protein
MSISGIGAGPPVKVDFDTSVNSSDSKRPDNKFVDRSIQQADGTDQRIEARVATVKQQVSGATDSSESESPRQPKMSSDLSFAITQMGIRNDKSSSQEDDGNQSDSSSPDPNKQSRSQSTQPIESKELKPKPLIQF